MRDRRAPAGLAGAFLFLCALAVLIAPEPRLVLEDERGTPHLVAHELTLRYRHSVERTIVEEDYTADAAGVRVVEMRFESFGAGLPSQAEWGGSFETLPDGRLAMRGMTATLADIRVRVGHVSEQTALAGGAAVVLATVVPPGETVVIRTFTRPRVLWWLAQ